VRARLTVGSHHASEDEDVQVEEGLEGSEFFEWEVTLLIAIAVLLFRVVHVFRLDGPEEVEVEDGSFSVEVIPEFWTKVLDGLVESADIVAGDL
jgi:hypothetical protein